MTLPDAAGLAGVAMLLAAFAGTTAGKLDPKQAPALLANLVGASLILWSLAYEFNLAATVMEAAWALVALAGLVRLVGSRR